MPLPTPDKTFVKLIAKMIKSLLREQEPVPSSRFHALTLPQISIENYINRFIPTFELQEDELLAILIYLERYTLYQTEYEITKYNIHRLVAVIIYTIHKFYEDKQYKTKHVAKCAGLTIAELNAMEIYFLFSIKFELMIHPATFKIQRALLNELACEKGITCTLKTNLGEEKMPVPQAPSLPLCFQLKKVNVETAYPPLSYCYDPRFLTVPKAGKPLDSYASSQAP